MLGNKTKLKREGEGERETIEKHIGDLDTVVIKDYKPKINMFKQIDGKIETWNPF